MKTLKRYWFLFMMLIPIAVVITLHQISESDYGTIIYSISPEMLSKEEGLVIENVGPMNIRKSNETLKKGYIEIQLNQNKADANYKYIVWVYNPDDPNQVYQFTLNNFEDWTMMPLPYIDQYIAIFQMTSDNYDKSFTTSKITENKLGFAYMNSKYTVPVETLACFRISGVGDYKQNMDCFTNKTVWVYWEDDCEAVMLADRLHEIYPVQREFELETMHFVNWVIKYETEKIGNRAGDKYYDFIFNDETIIEGKGVCSDISAVYCIMMRSQGIPCQYIDGFAAGDKKDGTRFEGPHAWNMACNDGDFTAYDPTNDIDFITQEYVVEQIK